MGGGILDPVPAADGIQPFGGDRNAGNLLEHAGKRRGQLGRNEQERNGGDPRG
ncbi:hypothetical protein D1872_322240 [compost metagenome]